jgi:DNA-binding LytR/AlgR family response regulator
LVFRLNFIREAGIYQKIKLQDILYVESDNVYLNIFTKEKCHVSRMKMEDFLSDYAHGNFFRIHRSFAINLHELESISTAHVVVAGKEVPMNKVFKDDLMKEVKMLK